MEKIKALFQKLPGYIRPANALEQMTLYPPLPMAVEQQPWYAFKKFSWLQVTLAVICITMLGMSFWHGITGDDIVMNEYGNAILKYFGTFGKDQYVFTNLNGADRDEVIGYYGGIFSVICALINKILPFEDYTVIHFFNALVGFVSIYFAARIANRYIGQGAAIITSVIMFLAPFYLGNAMNNPKDIPFAATYIMSLFFIIRFVERLPNVTYKDYIWLILSIAVSINMRVAGILLIPYMLMFIGCVNLYRSWHYKEKLFLFQHFEKALFVGVLAYLGSTLLWPWALQNPITRPLEALAALSDFDVNLTQLWAGKKFISFQLPLSYLPVAFLITNPFVVLVGLVIAFVFILTHKTKKSLPFLLLAFLLFTAIFPVAYVIYKHSNVYHLWRHMLFIFPSIAILCSYAYNHIATSAKGKNLKLVSIAIVALLLAEPLIYIVKTFPNSICYFNKIAGGTQAAYGNFEVDFYYNSLLESTNWFKKNVVAKVPHGDTIVLATNAPHIMGEYMKNEPRVKVQYARFYERHKSFYDYGLFHIALIPEEIIRGQTWTKGPIVYSASVEGRVLNAITKKPNNLDAEGMVYYDAENYGEAIPRLIKAYESDPSNELVAVALVDYYQKVNNMDSASIYINKLNSLVEELDY